MYENRLTTRGRRSLLAVTIGILGVSGLEAQPQQQQQQGTITITHRKAAPGKAVDQRKFVETSWKKFMQVAVDEGRLQGAMVLRLTAPYAAGAPSDWTVVTFPTKRPSLASPDRAVGEAQAKKAGFASLQAYLDLGNSLATVVKAEWANSTIRIGSMQAGNYIRSTRYMVEPDHRAEQMNFLRDVSMRLQAHTIKDGRIVAWSVNTPLGALGGPNEAGYSHSVSVVFKDADSVLGGPGGPANEATFKQVFPTGMTFANFITQSNRINEHRKTISVRISEIVAVVGKIPEITPARPQQ
jgi:hypothetical protein